MYSTAQVLATTGEGRTVLTLSGFEDSHAANGTLLNPKAGQDAGILKKLYTPKYISYNEYEENKADYKVLDAPRLTKGFGNIYFYEFRGGFNSKDYMGSSDSHAGSSNWLGADSRAPGQAKSTEDSAIFALYRAFATPAETKAFAKAFASGIGRN